MTGYNGVYVGGVVRKIKKRPSAKGEGVFFKGGFKASPYYDVSRTCVEVWKKCTCQERIAWHDEEPNVAKRFEELLLADRYCIYTFS